jgi:hypothetical protein
MSIKEGDIIFVHTNSWVSRMINLVQRGKFATGSPSHVAVVVSVHSSVVMLIEANLRGVVLVPLKTYDKSKVWHKRIKSPKKMQLGLILLNEQLGVRYDFLQLWGIAARAFFRLFGKRVYQKSKTIRNFLDSRTRFICSELVYLYIQEVTGKKPWKSHISQTTPWDLFRSPLLKDV